MGRRSNFNDPPAETHRFANFTGRLAETINSELNPEQVTPNTAGAEELPEYESIFPLTRQFCQTNFRGSVGHGRSGSDDQRQSKDRPLGGRGRNRGARSEEEKSGDLG